MAMIENQILLKRKIVFFLLSIGIVATIEPFTGEQEVKGADWPGWQGPNRNGITPESSGWPDHWPPKQLWNTNVGMGCTSPVIVADKLYVMGWQGKADGGENPMGIETVYCLEAVSGNVLWQQSYPSRYQGRVRMGDENSYGGPSSTPAFDITTNYLYTIGSDGDFCCWDTNQEGKLLWEKNFYEDYKVEQRPFIGPERRDYGLMSSPLLSGDLVIMEVGSAEGTVMAFDKKTGNRIWCSALKEPAGHSAGPVPLQVEGIPCLANFALTHLNILRLDPGFEGHTLAQYEWKTDFGCNISSPAVVDNKVLITSNYNQSKTALLEITQKGIQEIWTTKDHSKVGNPVIYKNQVFLVNMPLFCLRLSDGERLWKGGNFGLGTCLVTAGDDKVLAFGNQKLVLLEAFPADNQYRELHRIDNIASDICYPQITLSNGLIVCKDKSGNMVCFSVR